jgi:hypothetical protein
LLVGAVALRASVSDPVIAAVSGVGGGTLVGAVSFETTLPAFLESRSHESFRGDVIAVGQTFAAGAVLTMPATAMIPDAYDKAEPKLSAGLWFVLGFAIATLLAVAGS